MIGLIFYYDTDIIFIKVDGNNVEFSNSSYGALITSIEGLRLNKAGVIKEHPDLKNREDWREEAIKRFKEMLSSLKSEDAIAEYIIQDLRKYGYTPKWKQKQGFRRVAIE